MANIVWTQDLSVNVNELDAQHKKLFVLINELDDAMREGKGREVLGKVMMGLISYTNTHFSNEEKYFDQFKYPDASSHKQEHSLFIKKINEFKSQFEANRLGLTIQISQFLNSWLQNHIKVTDKKYGPFFNQHGLK